MAENSAPNALTQDMQNVEREYRQKVTVVNARPRIVQAVFLAWGALIAFFVLFFLASIGWYGVNGIFEDGALKNALLVNSARTHSRLQAAAPKSLLVGDVQSVPTGSGAKYDLYVQIENPNARHAVEFAYAFSFDGGDAAQGSTFLNPGEKAYIVASRASDGRPKNATVAVSEIAWAYLSPHAIANVSAWSAEHEAFSVSDVTFARDIAYADTTVSRTTFTVTNHTPYSYWEPSFTVRVLRGSTLLGIANMTAAQFKAGEARTIDMRWFGDLPQTATVTVAPRIPFFDEDAYMNPEASATEDVRSRWTVE